MFALWFRLKTLWAVRKYAKAVGRLFLDQRVSPGLKVAAGLGALLVVSPVDLLADIPVLGALDDFALLTLLAMLFVRFCPPEAVAEHLGRPALKKVTPL